MKTLILFVLLLVSGCAASVGAPAPDGCHFDALPAGCTGDYAVICEQPHKNPGKVGLCTPAPDEKGIRREVAGRAPVWCCFDELPAAVDGPTQR